MSDNAGNTEMTWPLTGAPLNPRSIGALTPLDVLSGQDQPAIYTAMMGAETMLVYVSYVDRQRQAARLIAVPVSPQQLDQLKAGAITLLQALDQPRVLAIDRGFDGVVTAAVSLSGGIAAVPDVDKPAPSAVLHPHLTPRTSG
ncbi:hypothetical protein [Rugamonas sp.]|uniref:hypothetical protein n=1 Tax=Rugamonas sp. TaxID=1926287 RepID=UPI0025D77C41|nr:hypothetical protein [Rugamonas sp.]